MAVVWLITNWTNNPLAAFTVKKKAKECLRRWREMYPLDPPFKIFRLIAGDTDGVVKAYDEKEFM